MSANRIDAVMDALPTGGVTVQALKALDFVAPGQWNNIVGFDNAIREYTGETDMALLTQVKTRALELFDDSSQGYQRALWLYQTVDTTDKVLGMSSMANEVGEKIKFLSFLSKITPKAEKTQAIDLSVKLVAELVAFTQVNGLPGDSIADFVKALGAYERESLIRMAALVCFDGLIPFGPEIMNKLTGFASQNSPGDLEGNQTFQRLKDMIPGGNPAGQLGFMGSALDATKDWIANLLTEHNLTREHVVGSLRNYIDITDDKLDFLAGFLDLTTNYYSHTGAQSLTRSLVLRAVNEV